MEKRYCIIDRSISEIANRKIVDWPQLVLFAEKLVRLGADLLELDARSIEVMNKIKGDFIYRLDNIKDLTELHRKKPFAVVIKCDDIFMLPQKRLKHKLIVEIDSVKSMEKLKESNLLDLLKRKYEPYCIRLSGIKDFEDESYFEYIGSLKSEFKVDICPYDTKGMATALAVEALEKGADYLTTSFCGYGNGTTYAPTEEVIMALKVIYGIKTKSCTEQLDDMVKEFETLTGKRVLKQKPVLGSDIFKCESEIHAEGLLKDPNIYEPYPPEMVGKKREIVLHRRTDRKKLKPKLSHTEE